MDHPLVLPANSRCTSLPDAEAPSVKHELPAAAGFGSHYMYKGSKKVRKVFTRVHKSHKSHKDTHAQVRNANRSHWTLWREAHWPSVRAESPFLMRLGSGLDRWITHFCCPPTPGARHYLIRKHHRSGMSSRQRPVSVHITCTRIRKRFEKCSQGFTSLTRIHMRKCVMRAEAIGPYGGRLIGRRSGPKVRS